MSISWINLFELINNNKNYINNIKLKYLDLLAFLTKIEQIDDELFFNNIKKINDIGLIYIGYIGNPSNSNFNIIATGTIIIEPKIIRSGKSVGHIEDIVTDINYRQMGLSKIILNKLKNYAIENNCYKIILDCDEKLTAFYHKNGFNKKNIQMSLYF